MQPITSLSPPLGQAAGAAAGACLMEHTFLGLLAKIKCSICSYQSNR